MPGYVCNARVLDKAFVLTQQSIPQTLSVTLVFVETDEMFVLNNQLRNKPTPTDVISLPFEQGVGEIYICPEFIKQQGHDLDRITHLWVHGLLHIAGFTHDTDETFKVMSDHEIHILGQLNIQDPYYESH